MMLFKACPRCHGDLQLQPDVHGGPPELCCFQCGGTVDIQRVVMGGAGSAGVTIAEAPLLPPPPIPRRFLRRYEQVGTRSRERTGGHIVASPPVSDR